MLPTSLRIFWAWKGKRASSMESKPFLSSIALALLKDTRRGLIPGITDPAKFPRPWKVSKSCQSKYFEPSKTLAMLAISFNRRFESETRFLRRSYRIPKISIM